MDYTLQEVVNRSGLSEHTLRYYEKIGLIDSVDRDHSSGHRRYNDDDLRIIEALACLRATGMSIEDMRKYREHLKEGAGKAQEQIDLFEAHRRKLEIELEKKQQHLHYLEQKVALWKAVRAGDEAKAWEILDHTKTLAQQLPK